MWKPFGKKEKQKTGDNTVFLETELSKVDKYG